MEQMEKKSGGENTHGAGLKGIKRTGAGHQLSLAWKRPSCPWAESIIENLIHIHTPCLFSRVQNGVPNAPRFCDLSPWEAGLTAPSHRDIETQLAFTPLLSPPQWILI